MTARPVRTQLSQLQFSGTQFRVASWTSGPVAVVGGDGTAKTLTLSYVLSSHIRRETLPTSCLVLAPTLRGARAVVSTAAALGPERCRDVPAHTFPSWALDVLRLHADRVGLSKKFTLLLPADTADIMQLLRVQLGLAGKERGFASPTKLTTICSLTRLHSTSVRSVVKRLWPDLLPDSEAMETLFKEYTKYKKKHVLWDHEDLLDRLLWLLDKSPPYEKKLGVQRPRYVLVDDLHLLAPLHLEILRATVQIPENILVTANADSMPGCGESVDTDGPSPEDNLTTFKMIFNKVATYDLRQDFRSSPPVRALADAVQGRSPGAARREGRKSTAQTPARLPRLVRVQDDEHQALWVAEKVENLLKQELALRDIAVLYPSGHHGDALEIELIRRHIPFERFGGTPFTGRAHVRDVLAHLHVIANPDNHQAWCRLLRLRPHIGKVVPLIANTRVRMGSHHELAGQAPKKAGLAVVETLLDKVSTCRKDPRQAVRAVARYYLQLLMRKHDDAGRRMWDLDRLARLARHYQTTRAFLRDLALESPPMAAGLSEDDHERPDALTLSTIDAAAGREWNTVFVLNVNGRDFSTRSGWTARSEQKAMVRGAVTRCRERLYLIRPCTDADDDNEEPPDLPAVLEGLPANLLKRTRARLGRPR